MTTTPPPRQNMLYFIGGALLVILCMGAYLIYQEQTKPVAGFQATANGETFKIEITDEGIKTSSEPAR
ncbi:MAG: hypothetical protein KKA05_00130 [Alphaproteobacteria bacterium]|nr:hypothetical protein [Alphaproteobacteria bacterium]MBU0859374.1 hypothetical protein [Alphaproteobacteria bacterium]